jgi:hypothetical protein
LGNGGRQPKADQQETFARSRTARDADDARRERHSEELIFEPLLARVEGEAGCMVAHRFACDLNVSGAQFGEAQICHLP